MLLYDEVDVDVDVDVDEDDWFPFSFSLFLFSDIIILSWEVNCESIRCWIPLLLLVVLPVVLLSLLSVAVETDAAVGTVAAATASITSLL